MLENSQDGGLVTALLQYSLDNRHIDGAIVSGISKDTPFLPLAKLVTTREAILESAGTRYSYSANILVLPRATGKAKALAFVGTPCQIRAIRKMQIARINVVANIKLLIGLLCSECFIYDGLMKEIHEKLGVRPTEIKKIDIKGKMLIKTEQETKTLSLADAKKQARKSCRHCQDFSSELADISAGGLGQDRSTLTIIRTEVGENLFSKAARAGLIRVMEPNESVLSLLRRFSVKKACDLSDQNLLASRFEQRYQICTFSAI